MESSSNQLKNHLNKSKMSKQDLIDSILSQTLSYIKVKKEPLTDSDSSGNISKQSHKSKDKVKSRRSTGNKEKELSKKQARKSLSANQIFDFSISKKIKTKKSLDDKESPLKKNEMKRDSIINKSSSEDEKLIHNFSVSQQSDMLENFISNYNVNSNEVNEKNVTPLKSNIKLSKAWSSPKKEPDNASEHTENNFFIKGRQKSRISNVVENIVHKEKVSKKTETDSQQSTSGFESEPSQLQTEKTNEEAQSPNVGKSTKKTPKKKATQLEISIDKQPLIIKTPNKHTNTSRRDSSSDSSSMSDVGQPSDLKTRNKPKYKLSGSKKFISTTESTNSDDEEMSTEIDRIIQMTIAGNKKSTRKPQKKAKFQHASKRKKANESYSSSDEDTVPKPIQIKSETRLTNMTVPVAFPLKSEPPYRVNEWKEPDCSVPRAIPLKVEDVNKQFDTENSSQIGSVNQEKRATSSDSQSSSEDEPNMPKLLKREINDVPVPRPLQIKTDQSKEESSDSESSSNKHYPVPRSLEIQPKATKSNSNDSKRSCPNSSAWEESPSFKKITTEADDSESSFDTDLPPPKKIALKPPNSAETDSNVLQNDYPDSSFCDETQNFKKMSWLDKLKHKYPALQEQSHTNINFPGTNVKYSILLVPKHIDPQSLPSLKTKHFTKEKTVKVNDKEFICEVLPVKPDPIIVAFTAPKLIEPQNTYCLREFLPSIMPLNELKSSEQQDIALPNQIKNKRHPLFGGNYKNKVKLSEEVCRQLQEAVERKNKVEEKERRRNKSKKKHISRGIEENVMNIFNSIDTAFENSHILANSVAESSYGSKTKLKTQDSFNVEHKSKKHKRKDLDAMSEELEFTELEKNKKKRKSS